MRYCALLAVVVGVFSGCAFTSAPIEHFDSNGLREITAPTLVTGYHDLLQNGQLTVSARDEIEAALIEKGVSPAEIPSIRANEIRTGMSPLAMYATWGTPRDENRTVGSWGVHIQHVYGSSQDPTYVYAENGVIESWQD